jgi:phospholipid/cholesterol/gamma-HCH transport system substrate-binding protein
MSQPTESRLAHTWNSIKAEPGFIRNLVVIFLALIVAVLSGAWMVGNASFIPPFGRKIIYVEFSQAPATQPSTTHKVQIAGVPIGQIVGSEVTPDGHAKLQLNIGEQYKIYRNARAVLTSINALNEMYIELNPGGPPAEEMKEGDTIPVGQTERPIQPDEILQHLDVRSQNAIKAMLSESTTALARAPQQLPPAFRQADVTLQTLRPVMEQLKTRRETLAQLVTGLSRIASAVGGNQDRITHLASSTEKAFGTLAANDRQLSATLAQLPGLSDQLRNSLSATQYLTRELNPTLDNLEDAKDELPKALDRTRDTAHQLEDTMDEARSFVHAARPVVHDLRPYVRDLNDALDDLRPATRKLGNSVDRVVGGLDDLKAFVYNTSSVFGPSDAQGSFIRAELVAPLPDGGQIPGGHASPGGDKAVDTPGQRKNTPRQAHSMMPNLGNNPLLGGK